MCAVLRETAEESGIDVNVVESDWVNADVEAADVILCSHVIYVIEDIGTFVRKINSHSRRLVLVVAFQSAPQSQIYQLWEQVHGEYRHPLPSLPNFTPVLDEMGITYEIEEMPPDPARGFDSEEKHGICRTSFYIAPGSDATKSCGHLDTCSRKSPTASGASGEASPCRPASCPGRPPLDRRRPGNSLRQIPLARYSRSAC